MAELIPGPASPAAYEPSQLILCRQGQSSGCKAQPQALQQLRSRTSKLLITDSLLKWAVWRII